MCESLRPGITVRPFASITLVAGPRNRKISRLLPVAMIFPSVIARASTNDGRLFVAILALCNIVSAGIDMSLAPILPSALFDQRAERLQPSGLLDLCVPYLCAPARADGITYSGNIVAGAP